MALGTSSTSTFTPQPPPASSAAAVADLQPPLLWKHFLTLSALPRPSKKEEAVVSWLRSFAAERPNLELREDKAGNVLLFRPGSGGGEDAEVVCVQGVSQKRKRGRGEEGKGRSKTKERKKPEFSTSNWKKKSNTKLLPTTQQHIDMVTEKDAGVEHDFERDPLLLRRSECGDWLTATGTTLVRSFCFWGDFLF